MKRITYRVRMLSPREKERLQETLFDELEIQSWFSITYISLWDTEIAISIQ